MAVCGSQLLNWPWDPKSGADRAQPKGEHPGFLESGDDEKGPQGKLPLVPWTAFLKLLSQSPAYPPLRHSHPPSPTLKKPHNAPWAVWNLLTVHSPSPSLKCSILRSYSFPRLILVRSWKKSQLIKGNCTKGFAGQTMVPGPSKGSD